MVSSRQLRLLRSNSGSIAAPAFCLALMLTLAIGGYCLSFNHAMVTRSELQNAADAAAIAAAQELSIDPEQATASGRKVAAMNFADGQRLTTKGKGVNVKLDVINSDGVYPGWVKVNVAKTVANPMNGLAGIPATTTVNASALSGVEGNVVTCYEDQLFPLAVSIDAVPMERTVSETPLNSRHLGESILLLTNAQQTRNATFTSFFKPASDCDYIEETMDQTLGVKPRTKSWVPRISTGDTINLNNSALGTHYLAGGDRTAALMRNPVITLPVIEGNPQQSDSCKVIGFISMRVVGFTLSASGHELDSLRGTLIKGTLRGKTGDLPAVRTEASGAALKELSAGRIKLLPANYLASSAVARHVRLANADSSPARPATSVTTAVNASVVQGQHAGETVPTGSSAPRSATKNATNTERVDNSFLASVRSGLLVISNPRILFQIWFLLLLCASAFAVIIMRRFFSLVR